MHRYTTPIVLTFAWMLLGCERENTETLTEQAAGTRTEVEAADASLFLAQPLVSHIYTADPSAHVFNGRIYIYPSHDVDAGIPRDDLGSHFAMRDYHVLSMDKIGGGVVDHGVVLDIENVPWASRQMWAPDAAEKDGKYFLYFPAKDKQDIFRIGVAVSDVPNGPFQAQNKPIQGSFSTDPAVFKDTDGTYYMYWGGLWGGQLQRWTSGEYKPEDSYPANDAPALTPKVARLSDDMLSYAEKPRDVLINDENGRPLLAGDRSRSFFEASWMHKYNGKYYFSYSTGDTHFVAYALGDSPYGPFTYVGKLLEPVLGWTTQHSIVEIDGRWHLFYHDSQLSSGETHLRNVKVTELKYNEDGTIQTVDAYWESSSGS